MTPAKIPLFPRSAGWAGALAVLPLLAFAAPARSQGNWTDAGSRPSAAAGAFPRWWSPWADTGLAEGETESGEEDSSGEDGGGGGQSGGPAKGRKHLPTPLGAVSECVNPGQIQYLFDEALGLDVSKWSDRPRAPEVPLAIYRQTIRPLGALKYETQPNFLVATFTGQAASLQSFSYDYVFADWHAARFEYTWANGDPQSLLLGYQRTLGVGSDHNWVHGLTFLPEYLPDKHLITGTATYTLAWKPAEKSPWTITPIAGVNRVDREVPAGAERAGGEGQAQTAWRPLLSLNLFYTLTDSLTVGVENDALIHNAFGEYLVMPLFNWRPTEHFFIQMGAGYYQIGSDGQMTFMCRANLFWPSPRVNRR